VKSPLAYPIVVYGLFMTGRAGPETGKLMTMIELVAVANKKNNWDQRMMTNGG
jgi:hypothetical protein